MGALLHCVYSWMILLFVILCNVTIGQNVDTTSVPTCCLCLEITPEAGCSADPECETRVCDSDPVCCRDNLPIGWDATCVAMAQFICDSATDNPTNQPTISQVTLSPTTTPSSITPSSITPSPITTTLSPDIDTTTLIPETTTTQYMKQYCDNIIQNMNNGNIYSLLKLYIAVYLRGMELLSSNDPNKIEEGICLYEDQLYPNMLDSFCLLDGKHGMIAENKYEFQNNVIHLGMIQFIQIIL